MTLNVSRETSPGYIASIPFGNVSRETFFQKDVYHDLS